MQTASEIAKEGKKKRLQNKIATLDQTIDQAQKMLDMIADKKNQMIAQQNALKTKLAEATNN